MQCAADAPLLSGHHQHPLADGGIICTASPEHRNVEDAANVLCARLVWPKGKNMRYEDQLHVWCLLLRNELAAAVGVPAATVAMSAT